MKVGFISSNKQHLFYILHVAANSSNVILYIPPFAEELNKSRAMVSSAAKLFAQNGQSVLLLDLFGCGDSEGNIEQITWQQWQQNITDAIVWLQQQGYQNIALWGLRLGCLLIADYLKQTQQQFSAILFWQPVSKGRMYIKQFVRLRIAAGVLKEHPESIKDLRKIIDQRGKIEIMGYLLQQTLINAIEKTEISAINHQKIGWFEVSSSETAKGIEALLPATQKRLETWNQSNLIMQNIQGEPFWQTIEITKTPELSDLSLKFIRSI